MRKVHPLKSCRSIQALIFASQDRQLTLFERTVKRLHLGICTSCTTVQHNVLTLRDGLRKWRAYADDVDQ